MLASELIRILIANPNAKVYLRYETEVIYSEFTSGTEDVIVCLHEDAVFEDEDRFTLCSDLCKKD